MFFGALCTVASPALAQSEFCSDFASAVCSRPANFMPDGARVTERGGTFNVANFNAITSTQYFRPQLEKLSHQSSTIRKDLWEAYRFFCEDYERMSPECESKSLDFASQGLASWLTGKQVLEPKKVTATSAAALYRLRHQPQIVRLLRTQAAAFERVTTDQRHAVESRILPRVKELMVSVIEQSVEDPTQRRIFADRIRSVKLSRENCFDAYGNVLAVNAYYRPKSNTLTMCMAPMFEWNSEFLYVQFLAHELAHAIDFCAWIRMESKRGYSSAALGYIESGYPVSGLVQCLRESTSVGARTTVERGVQTSLEMMEKQCRDGDQSSEGVPDWFSAQVLSAYVDRYLGDLTVAQRRNGYVNANRALCGHEKTNLIHPSTSRRLNRIIAANPTVRAQLGCHRPPPNGIRHCGPVFKPGSLRQKPASSSF